MNLPLLRDTFKTMLPDADAVATRFYDRMFRVYPQVKPLFANADPAEQRKKLMASIAAVVALADKPDELSPVLSDMGRRHKDYGVEPRQYAYVSASLLATLAEHFGEGWTPEASDTWSEALTVVSDAMIKAQAAA